MSNTASSVSCVCFLSGAADVVADELVLRQQGAEGPAVEGRRLRGAARDMIIVIYYITTISITNIGIIGITTIIPSITTTISL